MGAIIKKYINQDTKSINPTKTINEEFRWKCVYLRSLSGDDWL